MTPPRPGQDGQAAAAQNAMPSAAADHCAPQPDTAALENTPLAPDGATPAPEGVATTEDIAPQALRQAEEGEQQRKQSGASLSGSALAGALTQPANESERQTASADLCKACAAPAAGSKPCAAGAHPVAALQPDLQDKTAPSATPAPAGRSEAWASPVKIGHAPRKNPQPGKPDAPCTPAAAAPSGGTGQDRAVIGVLYGFRALMVLFVCNYHIWQQGWLPQMVTVWGVTLEWDFWTRSSYLFVDGMLLLSGFLLYLPWARQTLYGTPVQSAGAFYWNRFKRIVPSYMASILLVYALVALPGGAYRDDAARNLDLLTHLTFTFTFLPQTYLYTPLNGALWTVAIEVQFYLLFPLLARATRCRPALTLGLMATAGVGFRLAMAARVPELAMWVNQLPAFLDVYALGMLGAIAYVRLDALLRAQPPRSALRRVVALFAIALFCTCGWLLASLLQVQSTNGLQGQAQLRLSQWIVRLPLAVTLLLMILAATALPRALQKLLDNRLMRFLATISFNLYIWHQVLSVQIAHTLFPASLHSDGQAQVAFTLLCYALALLVAMAATYGLEQPAARRLERLRRRLQTNGKKEIPQ